MKIQKTVFSAAVKLVLCLFLLVALQRTGYAADGDDGDLPLPPPNETNETNEIGEELEDDVPPPTPPADNTQTPPLPTTPPTQEEAAPNNSISDDSPYLPNPSATSEPMVQQDSEIEEAPFLPPPAGSGELTNYYNPAPENISYSEEEASRNSSFSKPGFGLIVGGASKNYPSTLVSGWSTGAEMGADIRFLKFSDFLSLHFNPSLSFNSGRITYTNYSLGFSDLSTRLGLFAELGIGRTFSFFGGFSRITNKIITKNFLKAASDLNNISLDEPQYKLGGGMQYDFYVIPHGSIGLRGYAEINYVSLSFIMLMEPTPKRRTSTNYGFER